MNSRRSLAVVVVAVLAVLATAAAEEPAVLTATTDTKALSTVEIDVDELKTLGTEVFNIAAHAKSKSGKLTFSSKLTLRTGVRDGKVELTDTWKIMGRTCHMLMTCKPDNILSLEECWLDMSARGKTASGKVVVATDTASGEIAGRRVAFSYPEGTVNLAAIFRIVTQLPDTKGVSYTFPSYSEAIEIRAQAPRPGETFSVTCEGTQPIVTEDGSKKCTKFTLNVRKPIELYVDADARLQKVVADNGDTIMVRQAETATATADP